MRPRFDWGRQVPVVTQGSSHLRYVGASQTLRLNSDAPLSYILSEACFVIDRPMNFILGPDETLLSGIEDTARGFEQETAAYWRTWTRAPVAAAGVAGRGDPRGHHAEVLAVRGHRRHRRGDDHQHPRGGRTAGATGTTATAGCATRSSWCARSTACPKSATMEDYLRWLNNVVVRSRGGHIQPLYGIGQEERAARSHPGPPAGLPRPGAGAGGQPGAGAFPARRVRQHRAGRRASRFTTIACSAAPAQAEFSHLEAVGEQAFRRLRPAGRRHVGAAHPRPRPHLVGADELGRLRPARQGRLAR